MNVPESSFEARRAKAREIGAAMTASFDAASSGRVHYGFIEGRWMFTSLCGRSTAAYEQGGMEPGFECARCRSILDRAVAS